MQKYIRTFLPLDFTLEDWHSIQPFYNNLLQRKIDTLTHFKQFLSDWSELEGALEEDFGWRYIHTSRDTANPTVKERYTYYLTDIAPHVASLTDQLHVKALNEKGTHTLRQETAFDLFFKRIENNLRCYREENIPIQTKIQINQQKFAAISGAMTVTVSGQELTLQQAAVHLESTHRPLRKAVYDQVQQRRLADKDALNALYTTLVQQRHQVALNAGFENFRDYSFVSMHRFDYTPQDCMRFHEAIREEVVPLLHELAAERKQKLHLDQLQPLDHVVDIANRMALHPFLDEKELMVKTRQLFEKMDPFLGECIRKMVQMGHVDLASRKGKAPGGYNCPLPETGVSFIFMNAASTVQDVLTMLHECGHAFHAFLAHTLPLNAFKHYPMEIAELASMSMELLTMPYWDIFFPNPHDLNRVKKQHLIHTIHWLPWMAAIDAFQHWVYTHPHHTEEARKENWNRIFTSFSDNLTDWTGYEAVKDHLWQKQLHLFEVPFYYIEYAIAQLGAIGVWNHAQTDPQKALQNYLDALRLGYTASIPTVYERAGVPFDFSREHIRKLAQHVRKAWTMLE